MKVRARIVMSTAALLAGAWNAMAAESVSLNSLQNQINLSKSSSMSLTNRLGLSARSTLKLESKKTQKAGTVLQKHAQYFDGLRVLDHTAVVRVNSAGEIDRLHGYLAKGLEEDIHSTEATLTTDQAYEAAKAAHQKLYKKKSGWNYQDLSAQKSIFVAKNGKASVVYRISFFAENETGLTPSRPVIMIDAQSGALVNYVDALTFADVEATGPGGNMKTGKYMYGTDYPALKATTADNTTCHFSTPNVKTIDLNHQGTGNPATDQNLSTTPHSFPCSENTAREVNGAFSPANDAHFFGTGVFNMYQEWYGINPLKTDLTLRVHYGKDFENAFWDGKQMTFGDGKDLFYPLVVLDVTAHEVSHGFTEFNSALAYESQSGGINEAFSDMAGEAAEYFMRGANDWKVGGEIAKTMDALRFMDDPTKDGMSIKHVKDFKEPTDQFTCLLCTIFGGGAQCAEFCGTDVHHSSGVYNKVFHDVAVSNGWNTRKAFDVFVKANQDYWTEKTNFEDGAAGVRDAAKDLGYDTAPIIAAFKEVGVNL